MFSVHINSRAERELKRLDRTIKNRIVTAALALANDLDLPVASKSKHPKVDGVFA